MFDIGFTELLLVGVVALIVVGPERLPSVIRTGLGYFRQFKNSFAQIKSDVERELDLADIKKELDDNKEHLSKAVGYDELHDSLDELRKESENLRDVADDGFEYAESTKDILVTDQRIKDDLEQIAESAAPNEPNPDAEKDTGIETDDTVAQKTAAKN